MHYSARLLGAIAQAHPIPNLQQHVYKTLLHQFEKAPRARIGLAISGGVDSMALATLCSGFKKKFTLYDFSGFIVDHGLRPGSAEEAENVADVLRGLGIEPEILRLDWTTHGDPQDLTNFETVARQLRYHALGKACYRKRIVNLLTGHHADDVAETVLLRMIARYLGEGLQGIRSTHRIPECQGVYGVDASGSPRKISKEFGSKEVAIESGGVFLARPLLHFTKRQLTEICQQDGVQWFEDSTNTDKALTVRNTIRHLQQSGDLPVALRRERLTALASSLHNKHQVYERRAKEIYESLSVGLDLANGKATFEIPTGYSPGIIEDAESYHVKALLSRKLLMLVSPLPVISLQDLDAAMNAFFGLPASTPARTQVQGVTIQHGRERSGNFVIHRQRPERRLLTPIEFSELKPVDQRAQGPRHWTDWLLWDNRYWIRIGCFADPPLLPPRRFSVSFLTPDTIRNMRASFASSSSPAFRALNHAIQRAGETKWAQPVISMKVGRHATVSPIVEGKGEEEEKEEKEKGEEENEEEEKGEEAIALPALGWIKASTTKPLHLTFQIRFKAIDFGRGDAHTLAVQYQGTRTKPMSRGRAPPPPPPPPPTTTTSSSSSSTSSIDPHVRRRKFLAERWAGEQLTPRVHLVPTRKKRGVGKGGVK